MGFSIQSDKVRVTGDPLTIMRVVRNFIARTVSQVEWETAEVYTPIGIWTLTAKGKDGSQDGAVVHLKVIIAEDNEYLGMQELALNFTVRKLRLGDVLTRRT